METILFLQQLGDWLTPAMKFFTFLGDEEFYLLIMPAIYWCFDTLTGTRLALMLVVTTGTNSILKLTFHSPRPFWVSSEVRAFTAETSFGIPSGHAQNATTLWGTWASSIKKRWAWYLALFFAIMIGISRLYMGMHFPIDVLSGWLAGGLILWIFIRLEKPVGDWMKNQSILWQILIIVGIGAAILLIGNLMIASLANWQIPSEWVANATQAGAAPEPLSRDGVTTAAGVFLGLALGLILIQRRGGFSPKGPAWQRVLRYLLGIVGTLAIWAGLKAVFPSGEALLPQALRLLRYALIGFWVTAGAPLIFLALKLANPPEKKQKTLRSRRARQ
ncbi:MAG: phosphatase PAP2 family protein [Anaerolineae bacterium]|nr:phosphatase PAP2 family protein [Anaerolineae bacterium]